MNMFELGERLKDFSKDQLVNEMRRPSGSVPQFLVLSELQRRRRMESAAMADQPQQTTVAEDAVAAAGVPQAGLMQMARALAPKTDMDQNTGVTEMSGGGVVRMQAGGLSGVSRDLGVYSPTMGTTAPIHSESGMLYSEMTGDELELMSGLGDADAAMELRARDGGVESMEPIVPPQEDEGPRPRPYESLLGFLFPNMSDEQIDEITSGWVEEGLPSTRVSAPVDELTGLSGTPEVPEGSDAIAPVAERQRAAEELYGVGPGMTEGDMLSPDGDLLPPPSMTMGDPSALLGEEDLLPPTPVDVSDEAETGAGGVGGGIDSDRLYEQDKWLALAQFGLGLMSSREPTLGGAIGEAGQAGIAALRDARESMVERQAEDRLMRLREAVAAREDEPAGFDTSAALRYMTQLGTQLDNMVPEGFQPSDLSGPELEEYLRIQSDYNVLNQALRGVIFGPMMS